MLQACDPLGRPWATDQAPQAMASPGLPACGRRFLEAHPPVSPSCREDHDHQCRRGACVDPPVRGALPASAARLPADPAKAAVARRRSGSRRRCGRALLGPRSLVVKDPPVWGPQACQEAVPRPCSAHRHPSAVAWVRQQCFHRFSCVKCT